MRKWIQSPNQGQNGKKTNDVADNQMKKLVPQKPQVMVQGILLKVPHLMWSASYDVAKYDN